MSKRIVDRVVGAVAVAMAVLIPAAPPVVGQLVRTYAQSPLPAPYDGSFRDSYPQSDRLLNALAYVEAALYGSLAEGLPRSGQIERTLFDLLTGDLRADPPELRVGASEVEPLWARLAPEAVAMLEWAALLQRQIYDVGSDAALSDPQRDAAIAELLAYYKTRPDIAVSSVPKSFDISDGQYFSLAFREGFPRSNGLSWAAQWLQVGLNEALLAAGPAERSARVDATVQRFWRLLEDAPRNLPRLMPVSSAVAPGFALRYPEAGIILDNANMLREVIADILASPEVPRGLKRDEMLRMAALFRSDTVQVISLDAWLAMGPMIGAENMGGIAGAVGAAMPVPTVPRGLSLASADTRTSSKPTPSGAGGQPAMPGMDHGSMVGPGGASGMQGMTRADRVMPAAPGQTGATGIQEVNMGQMMAMHERMVADPVIRERMATDPVLLRMMEGTMQGMGGAGAMEGMAGMQGMGGMQGMQHGSLAAGDSLSPADRARALDFVARLLSDPLVEARLRADPALRRLWSDPEVQQRLEQLRSAR